MFSTMTRGGKKSSKKKKGSSSEEDEEFEEEEIEEESEEEETEEQGTEEDITEEAETEEQEDLVVDDNDETPLLPQDEDTGRVTEQELFFDPVKGGGFVLDEVEEEEDNENGVNGSGLEDDSGSLETNKPAAGGGENPTVDGGTPTTEDLDELVGKDSVTASSTDGESSPTTGIARGSSAAVVTGIWTAFLVLGAGVLHGLCIP